MGISAVHMARPAAPIAPFFRFPALQHPPQLMSYLGRAQYRGVLDRHRTRSISSCASRKQVIKSVMSQAGEARQGHHPDARLPARHGGSDAGTAAAAQGGRLQGRASRAAAIRSPRSPNTTTWSNRPTSCRPTTRGRHRASFHTIGEYKGSPARHHRRTSKARRAPRHITA